MAVYTIPATTQGVDNPYSSTLECQTFYGHIFQLYNSDNSYYWEIIMDNDQDGFFMLSPVNNSWCSVYVYANTPFSGRVVGHKTSESSATFSASTNYGSTDKPIYVFSTTYYATNYNTSIANTILPILIVGEVVNNNTKFTAYGYAILYDFTPPTPPPSDPYAGGASAGTTGGGEGTADNSDDLGTEVIAEPTEPTVSAVATGFLSLWTGTESQIQDIASFLWNDLANVQDVLNALIRIVADPMKLIIGLSIVPSQGLHKGSSAPVTVGPFLTGLNLTKLTSQYFTVDCGSLSFDTVCGNTFLDYAPYSKFSIYLPYIGTRTVDANDFVGHTISVKYKGDALTGNCVAFILKDNSVMYQFAGSLSSNCPLSSNDWTQTIMSAVQMAATGISMAATGGASAPAAAAMGAGEASSLSSLALNAASNISGNTSQLSPQVMKSGAVSGASGLLGVQTPYIIREAVSYQDTTDFNTLGGYPSNIYSLLSDLTGYTEVQSIHLTGMTCTQAEMDEIETLLHQGVII